MERKMKFVGLGVVILSSLGYITITATPALADSQQNASQIGTQEKTEHVPLNKILRNKDGSTSYVYMVDGVANTITVPPDNFNPLTATNQQLLEFGYPVRPTKSSDMAKWTNFVTHRKIQTPPQYLTRHLQARNPLGDVTSQPSTKNPNHSTTIMGAGSQETWSSTNYSGYIADSTYNEWTAVSANYTQPTDYGTKGYVSDWVGIGGWNCSPLIQAGTWTEHSQQPYAWYEYLNGDTCSGIGNGIYATQIPGIVVFSNTGIKASVTYEPNNGDTVVYQVVDYSTNSSNSVTISGQGSFYNGQYADFIDERPTVGGSLTDLLDFDQIPWSNAQVLSTYGYWNAVGNLNNYYIYMQNSSGTADLANPSSLNSDEQSWTNYWDNYN